MAVDSNGVFARGAACRRMTAGSGLSKAVLMCLLEHSDASFFSWPSVRTIARETEFCERAVRKALSQLESRGLIRRTRRVATDGTGRQTANGYTIVIPDSGLNEVQGEGASGAGGRVHDMQGGAACGAGRGLHVVHPLNYPEELPRELPRKNTSSPDGEGARRERHDRLFGVVVPKGSKAVLEPVVERVYGAYPRKVAPKKAKPAIVRCVLRMVGEGRDLAQACEWVEHRTGLFAGVWSDADDERRRFIPHPTTWFNRDGPSEDEREWSVAARAPGNGVAAGGVDREREFEEQMRVAERARWGDGAEDLETPW